MNFAQKRALTQYARSLRYILFTFHKNNQSYQSCLCLYIYLQYPFSVQSKIQILHHQQQPDACIRRRIRDSILQMVLSRQCVTCFPAFFSPRVFRYVPCVVLCSAIRLCCFPGVQDTGYSSQIYLSLSLDLSLSGKTS